MFDAVDTAPASSRSGSVAQRNSNLTLSPGSGENRTSSRAVADIEDLCRLTNSRRRVKRGETLYDAGQPFSHVYVVRLGMFKSFATSEDGVVQVTGFPMIGDVIGVDGIETGLHCNCVVALEDSEVCVVPFAHCERVSLESARAQRLVFRILAREIARNHDVVMMLGTMRAERKVAAFLIDLSTRYGQLGYSRTQFVLRMTREEIGSYVGLTLETVSRILSRLQKARVVDVDGKLLSVLDAGALRELAGRGGASDSDCATHESAVMRRLA